jgi:hypothetical protein
MKSVVSCQVMGKGTGATMLWRREGRFVLTVHSAKEPTESEWRAYLAQAGDHRPLEDQRILVLSAGGAPTAVQRREMVSFLDGAQTPTAIVTGSWIMRGAGTAVSWFNPSLRVFGPRAASSAMDYLGLTGGERRLADRLIREFQRDLGIELVRTSPSSSELGA